jgi:hypothetical protein
MRMADTRWISQAHIPGKVFLQTLGSDASRFKTHSFPSAIEILLIAAVS